MTRKKTQGGEADIEGKRNNQSKNRQEDRMNFDRKNCSNEELVRLYRSIVLSRMIEEKMLVLLRQGRISKWFSGIGQEAIAVGATLAMQQEEWILPLHRNLGVFTSRGMPLSKLFLQWQGSADGYSL